MTLEVSIDEIQIGSWGWTSAGGWPHDCHKRLGFVDSGETFMLWSLDRDRMVGRNQHGHEVALRPFMGVMGMPTDEPGEYSTAPPRATGGNLDCKELVQGTTLYLPVEVPGALFSVGDGHAAQGDGELCVTAIECPMERVQLTFRLRDDFPIATPHARAPDAWITLGLHEDLQEATYRAIEAMLDLMVREHGFSRGDAYALASLVVDLRITQIVNGVRGVHAVLRDGAVRG
ncbi:Acetamidase/Formamidase [Fimbriimonas ginsengisoli Gsoil 348]|uniref:Acetamidase/Formamidase n=2 Tax=Fimbriimonas ginsengisoli TaxID=1005039 RepID=A0A068NS35_FIMGI|nr:Acetamidase/Formamidase [Fimbriimonas ginsengisoli Gsoil 348]